MKTIHRLFSSIISIILDSKDISLIVGLLLILVAISLFMEPSGDLLSQRNFFTTILVLILSLRLIFYKISYERLFTAATLTLVPLSVGLILVLFWLDVKTADWIAQEDGLVENASFVFLLLGALAMWVATLYYRRVGERGLVWTTALLGLLFFIIAGEEISWFQRVAGVESTEFFLEHNMQGEMNLHNFDTMLTSRIYYVGGFVLLVIIPFFKEELGKIFKKLGLAYMSQIVVPIWLLLPFLLSSAFRPVLGPQSLFSSAFIIIPVLIVVSLMIEEIKKRQLDRILYLMLILALFLMTTLSLSTIDFGQFEVRHWFDSEYRELFIAWGIFAFSGYNMFHASKLNKAANR